MKYPTLLGPIPEISFVDNLVFTFGSLRDSVRLPSPEPVGWIQHHQLYSGAGADVVMESIALIGGQWVDCTSKKTRMRANELSLLSATHVVLAAGGRAP